MGGTRSWHKTVRSGSVVLFCVALGIVSQQVRADEEQIRTCTAASTPQCYASCETASPAGCSQVCSACGEGWVPNPSNPGGDVFTGLGGNCDPMCGLSAPCCAWRTCGCRESLE